jgi:hypothetical protein
MGATPANSSHTKSGRTSLSRWTIGIYWWSAPFQIALMMLLAIASYRYVETPLRHLDWATVRWKSIEYGLGASAATAVLLFGFAKIPNLSLYVGRIPSLAALGTASLVNTYTLKQTNSLWGGNKCVLSENAEVGKQISIADCTLGDFANAKKRIMVFGDSFSASFTQAFDDLVISDGYAVTITSSWGASPVKEIPNNSNWDKVNDYYWNSVIPSLISQLKGGDWVFLANDIAGFSPKYKTSETSEHLQQLEKGLATLSENLSTRGIRLAVLHGNPFAREASCPPVIAAKQWFHLGDGPCQLPGKSESLLRRNDLNKVLVALEATGKLAIIDLFDIFCPEEKCTYHAKNSQVLYRDEYSHPSIEGARLASPIIRQVLTSSSILDFHIAAPANPDRAAPPPPGLPY